MISPPIPRYTRASLRQVGVSSLTPLLVNRWWYTWQVDRLDETLGPGVDTHKSPVPALFQKPVAGVVVVSFLDIKPH